MHLVTGFSHSFAFFITYEDYVSVHAFPKSVRSVSYNMHLKLILLLW